MIRKDILQFPLDFQTGASMSEDEKLATITEVGERILLLNPELSCYSGDLAKKIHDEVGSGIGFSRSCNYAFAVYQKDLDNGNS